MLRREKAWEILVSKSNNDFVSFLSLHVSMIKSQVLSLILFVNTAFFLFLVKEGITIGRIKGLDFSNLEEKMKIILLGERNMLLE